MNDRRILQLLYVLLAMAVVNTGLTLYFQLSRRASNADPVVTGDQAAVQISENEAMLLARDVVDLYNANRVHELYVKFDDLARVQLSEQTLAEEVTRMRAMTGRIEEFAYINTEIAGTQGGRTYSNLNFATRLSGSSKAGNLKIIAIRKGGQLAFFGFSVRR